MNRYFTSLAAVGAAVASLAVIYSSDTQEVPKQNVTPAPSKIEIDAKIVSKLTDSCIFYANILRLVDAEHYEGPTNTSHEDMAYAALQAMLSNTYVENFYDEQTETFDDSVITYSGAGEKYIDTLTLGNTVIDIDRPAPGTISSYDGQCRFMLNAAVSIHDTIGTDIFSLYEYAVNGALNESRDPHTSYLPPVKAQALRTNSSGKFGGLGIEVSKGSEGVVVSAPIEGTPAEKAGIVAGDIIIKADGQPLQPLTLDEAVRIMRGPIGTDIAITIKRGAEEPFDLTITRDTITVTAATVAQMESAPHTAHIKVKKFSSQTYGDIHNKYQLIVDSAEFAGQSIDNIILDFRNNPGGLLTQAELVSDLFIQAVDPENPQSLVATGRTPNEDVVKEDSVVSLFRDIKAENITVLVNRGSASASEIVAGALQDAGREVVGNRSFGKGSVQTVIPVSSAGRYARSLRRGKDYASIKITTDAFFPGRTGLSNQASGIIPNVDVQYNDIRDDLDRNGRREADLKNALHIPGKSRINQTSEYLCSLKVEFSGALNDAQLAAIPDELELTLRIRNEITDELEPKKFFDADLHCAVMRQQGIDDSPYAKITISPTTPAP